jgi:hypothetical protein
MTALPLAHIHDTLLGLDRWFESTRVTWPVTGYGGPVVHWWNHCLEYRGAGLDWRYEGVIAGYLSLWRRDGSRTWLDRAIRAGLDLVQGQSRDGHYRNSRFERNPGTGGTPHEAAADIGLLLLASALRVTEPEQSDTFFSAARLNLERYFFDALWHSPTSTLRDGTQGLTFVPNKAATFIDAVILLADLDRRPDLIETYAIPAAEHILAMQHPPDTGLLGGAIAQNRIGARIVDAYYPLYIARCVPPLLTLAARTSDLRYRDAALAALEFLRRVQDPDGGFPQVVYRRGRLNRYPRWIAGAGDILRAFIAVAEPDDSGQVARLIVWMLSGRRSPGHIATSEGLERIIPLRRRRHRPLNELGVVGWCDKAFRALALVLEQPSLIHERETMSANHR